MKLLVAVGMTAVCAGLAAAHGRSLSYSRWELTDRGARVELRVSSLDLTRIPPAQSASAYVAGRLRLVAGSDPCVADRDATMSAGADGWTLFRWTVRCESAAARAIQSALMAGMVTHVHFARVVLPSGEVRERFLVEGDPAWTVEARSAADAGGSLPDTLRRYALLGVEHILTGWDHLAFLLALLLLAASLREVTTLVTGFTIAHSATLGLAALGIVRPEPAPVEALIGFSIALVAAENLWLLGGRDPLIPLACGSLLLLPLLGSGALPRLAWLGLGLFSLCHFGLLGRDGDRARVRAAVAFAFGLVHGFGFAGVLMEAELPTSRLVPALFGFNLGVELGQLFLVALAWPLLRTVARREDGWHRRLAEAGSVATLAIGTYCVVTRAF